MKISFGFLLGFAAGAYVGSKLTEEQRAGFVDKIDHLATTGRAGKITGTLRHGVSDVADVATERITDSTEMVTDAAASALSGDDSSDDARPGASTLGSG
jgi:hypothetical protein